LPPPHARLDDAERAREFVECIEHNAERLSRLRRDKREPRWTWSTTCSSAPMRARSISVRARSADNTVRIEVEDDGPGVDEQHRARIFERFYAGGTGLGLAIVKHLAEALDGQIGLDAVDPHGCRFWLVLPRA
jgi:hypothetical protein